MSFGARQTKFRDQVMEEHTGRPVKNLDEFRNHLRKYLFSLTHPVDKPLPPTVKSERFFGGDEADTFDSRPVLKYTLDHLDEKLIQRLLEAEATQNELQRKGLLGASRNDQLFALGIIDMESHPTYGAFLCFAQSQHLRKFSTCILQMSVYPTTKRGTSNKVSVDSRTDNIINLYDIGMNFFSTSARLEKYGRIGSRDRDDLEIPLLALREALANALIHREYEQLMVKNQPTKIEVYPDRVEITSFGALIGGISVSAINDYPESIPSLRRNPIITQIVTTQVGI